MEYQPQIACQFCRVRKLKCDKLAPQCGECRTRALKCLYVQRPKKPRPSNSRIRHLEEENRRLRELTQQHASSQAQWPLSTTSYEDPIHRDGTSPSHSLEKEDIQVPDSNLQISSTGRSSYHGPTSTLFHTGSSTKAKNNKPSEIPTEWIRSSLVAATLRQRQKEPCGAISSSYDFDGWDPGLVLHLLNIHWNRQHHNLLIIYRPAFMRDMATGGPYFSKLLLNAILFAVSKFSPRVDIRADKNERSTAGWQFRRRFRELLGEAMDDSTIPTIQALITVASSLFAIGDRRPTSWLYSGTAFRMLVDLGLHVDGVELLKQQKLTAEDLEIRRRVFWGAFVFDKIHSMYQGRPVTLQERDMQVPIVFLDDFEELERWVPLEELNFVGQQQTLPKHPGGPTYSVSTFSAFCRLSLIMNRTLNHIYAERAFQTDDGEGDEEKYILKILCSLDSDLEQWWNNLQPWLKYEPWASNIPTSLEGTPCPSILSLHCMYHIFVVFVHRPFLARGARYPEEVAKKWLLRCTKAALRIAYIVQTYSIAFTIERAPYFIAYAAYVASTILIRLAAHQQPTCNTHKCLCVCQKFLSRNEKTNAGVKRANYVIRSMLKGTSLAGCTTMCNLARHRMGGIINDEIVIDPSIVSSIMESFSTISRSIDQTSLRRTLLDTTEANHQTSSAEKTLFASIEAPSTPAFMAPFHGDSRNMTGSQSTPESHDCYDSNGFNDMIFGLHGSSFLDSWPEYTGEPENFPAP